MFPGNFSSKLCKTCKISIESEMWKETSFDVTQEVVAFVLSNSEEYSSYVTHVGTSPVGACSHQLQCG